MMKLFSTPICDAEEGGGLHNDLCLGLLSETLVMPCPSVKVPFPSYNSTILYTPVTDVSSSKQTSTDDDEIPRFKVLSCSSLPQLSSICHVSRRYLLAKTSGLESRKYSRRGIWLIGQGLLFHFPVEPFDCAFSRSATSSSGPSSISLKAAERRSLIVFFLSQSTRFTSSLLYEYSCQRDIRIPPPLFPF